MKINKTESVIKPNKFRFDVKKGTRIKVVFFDEIEEKLSMKIDCPIISLEDILYEI